MEVLKRNALHIFYILWSVQAISDGRKLDIAPQSLHVHLKCYQNKCELCDHRWNIKYSNIRAFQTWLCLECGTILIATVQLALFWYWCLFCIKDQIEDYPDDSYRVMIQYYAVEHALIMFVFVLTAKMYFDEIKEYRTFHVLTMKTSDIINRTLIDKYRLMIFVMINRLIVEKALLSCIGDQWMYSLILQFVCGDDSVNVLQNKKVFRTLESTLTEIENPSDETFDEIDIGLERVSTLSSCIGTGGAEIDIPTTGINSSSLKNVASLECGISNSASISSSSISISVHSENHERDQDMRQRTLMENYTKYFNEKVAESMDKMGRKTWEDIRGLMDIYLR